MGKPLNRQGSPWGGRLLSGALLIGLPLATLPASAQLYGAGRNNSAVIVDEDVLSSLGGAGPRPGVGVGFLPAPPAPPRSKLNQVPPPKAKPAPAGAVASPALASPVAPAAPAAAPTALAPTAPIAPEPVVPSPPEAISKPVAPRPDPGPPPEAPKPAPTPQTAAISTPPGPAPAPVSSETGLRVLFLPDSPDVPTTARAALDTMVKRLQSQPDRRVLITAYAAGTPETASQSRRLSLNRALAVRSFLAEKGISTARLDVRALGAQVADGPADRVDIDLTTP